MCIGSLTLCTSYKSLGSYSSTDELNCDFMIESELPLPLVDIVLKPLLLSTNYKFKIKIRLVSQYLSSPLLIYDNI